MESMTESQKKIYKKYKPYLVSATILLFSFFLLFQVAIPNFSNAGLVRQQMDEEKKKISNLQSTLNIISRGVDDAQLNSDVKMVTKALPDSKSFFPIFMSLFSASSKSSVSLGEFSIKVGNVYTKEKVGDSSPGKLFLSIALKISSTDINNIIKFPQELYKSLPLAEVQDISMSESSGTYNVQFYYKPYDLTLLNKQDKINQFSPSQQQILEKIRGWDKGEGI
ncbi:hypothetical protein C4577_05890 [Candidatus Parcubacteria bacterium]|nr:MAG: hypothetical protein C4577_05890 [Candidatus Parcubacteria bacterium]